MRMLVWQYKVFYYVYFIFSQIKSTIPSSGKQKTKIHSTEPECNLNIVYCYFIGLANGIEKR